MSRAAAGQEDPGQLAAARRDLAAALEQGEPCRADREVMLAALRDIARLAGRWRAGINDVGPAAAAEVMDAIRGEHTIPVWTAGYMPEQQPGALPMTDRHGTAGVLDEDAPFRGGGVRPGE